VSESPVSLLGSPAGKSPEDKAKEAAGEEAWSEDAERTGMEMTMAKRMAVIDMVRESERGVREKVCWDLNLNLVGGSIYRVVGPDWNVDLLRGSHKNFFFLSRVFTPIVITQPNSKRKSEERDEERRLKTELSPEFSCRASRNATASRRCEHFPPPPNQSPPKSTILNNSNKRTKKMTAVRASSIIGSPSPAASKPLADANGLASIADLKNLASSRLQDLKLHIRSLSH
jgi:hypothetical protein